MLEIIVGVAFGLFAAVGIVTVSTTVIGFIDALIELGEQQ